MDNSEYAEKMNSMRNELSRAKTPNRNHFDFTPYEGQLVRVNRDKVYLVKNGQGSYVSKLPLPDGRGWESVREVSETTKKSGLAGVFQNLGQTVKAFVSPKKAVQAAAQDPMQLKNSSEIVKKAVIATGAGVGLAALAPVVAELPVVKAATTKVKSAIGGGNPVTNPSIVTTSTNVPANSNSLIDKVTGLASNVSPQVKNAVINKGKELLTDKLGNLTRAPEMLPKTKALVDAERYVDAGGGEQPQLLQSSISMFSSTAIMMTIGAVILLIVFSKLNNN